MKRFEQKLECMKKGSFSPEDFILADAKDADMAAGLSGVGRVRGANTRLRNLGEFDDEIARVIEQDIVDIMLTSVSTMERLNKRGALADSAIQPAVRLNDTTDVWRIRHADFNRQSATPFRTANLFDLPVNLGLYSVTFSGIAEEDAFALDCFREFRAEASEAGVRYFLEIFNPSHSPIASEDFGDFNNDMLTRALAGVTEKDRPVFLKLAYNGAESLAELTSFDPSLVVGIMGGGSGTTRDCLELLSQAQHAGARAALFGRKILDAEDPLSMIAMMRAVTNRTLTPEQAVTEYHQRLDAQQISPQRSIIQDQQVTESTLLV